MFNLTSSNSLWASHTLPDPVVGNPDGAGEGQRLRMGVEGPEIQDLV